MKHIKLYASSREAMSQITLNEIVMFKKVINQTTFQWGIWCYQWVRHVFVRLLLRYHPTPKKKMMANHANIELKSFAAALSGLSLSSAFWRRDVVGCTVGGWYRRKISIQYCNYLNINIQYGAPTVMLGHGSSQSMHKISITIERTIPYVVITADCRRRTKEISHNQQFTRWSTASTNRNRNQSSLAQKVSVYL